MDQSQSLPGRNYYPTIRSAEPFQLGVIPLILESDAPKKEYTGDKSIAPNKGQRKLMELVARFLLWVHTQVNGKTVQIIYVGSAPGVSIPYVDQLIQGDKWIRRWVLWDPVRFCEEIVNSDRFEHHQDFFTNATAKEYIDQINMKYPDDIIVYIDDIRLAPPDGMDKKSKEFCNLSDQLVWDNLQSTIGWMNIIRPHYWMTKYRTPYHPVMTEKGMVNSVQYPPGITYFECWNGGGSTETRKWGTRDDLKRFYENPLAEEFQVQFEDHEQRMQYYNAIQRPEYYPHNIKFPGICHCLDCAHELDFHQRMVLFRQVNINPVTCAEIIQEIEKLDAVMPHDSKLLDTKSPHGLYPDIPPKDLKNLPEFRKKQEKYQQFKESRKIRRGSDLVKKAPDQTHRFSGKK
jgi:hypothetical protein